MSARPLSVLALLAFPARSTQPQLQPPHPRAAVPVTATARALAGCYVLRAGFWSVPADARGVVLPAQIRLDAKPTNSYEPGLRASPDVTAFHELPYAPGWRPDGPDALIISWFDGFTGPRVRLVHRGDAWEGVATFIYHDGSPSGQTPTAAVSATRVPCAALPRRPPPR